MTLSLDHGLGRAVARALLALSLLGFWLASAASTKAAPLAAELGPTVSIGEPAGGYVGRLGVTPDHGPVGTTITISGQGMPAGQDIELVWSTVNGRWKVGDGEYHGRSFDPVAYRIATV